MLQFQSDLLGIKVRRPVVTETTALGAAYLAGLAVGYWSDRDELRDNWQLDREFTPQMPEGMREKRFARWKRAVQRSLAWEE